MLRCRVVHLYHGHAEVDSQSVHVEEAEEAEYRQRVSGRDPRERVDAAQSVERRMLAAIVQANHLFLGAFTILHDPLCHVCACLHKTEPCIYTRVLTTRAGTTQLHPHFFAG